MKKNLILLGILSVLLALTYWYEEIGGEKRLSKTKQAKALFQNKNLGNLKGIKFPKFDLILKERKYYTKQSNYPVDKRKIDKIIEVLSSMEVISIIDKENIKTSRDNFFSQEDLIFTFQFERGEISYKLGAKLEVSSDFYVEVSYLGENNLVVARDTTPQYGIYQEKSLERSSQKYERLKFILGLREKDLFDTNPFKNFNLNLEKVIVDNFRNKKFQIDFTKRATDPEVFKSLSYKSSLFDEFEHKLKNLYAINIYFNPNQKDLSNLQSILYLPQKTMLFKNYKGRVGYFLKVDGDNDLYELAEKDSNLFFTNVQDLWNKEILKEKDYHVPTIFIFKGKPKVSVKIKDTKPFEVQSFDAPFKVNQDSFRKIYSLLLNSAERVSELDFSLKGQKSLFEIQVNDLMFKVIKTKKELLFVSEKDKLVYIYDVGVENPINVKFEDYFYQKK